VTERLFFSQRKPARVHLMPPPANPRAKTIRGLRVLSIVAEVCPSPCEGMLAEDHQGRTYCLECGERFRLT
jgi:hypothetical protein